MGGAAGEGGRGGSGYDHSQPISRLRALESSESSGAFCSQGVGVGVRMACLEGGLSGMIYRRCHFGEWDLGRGMSGLPYRGDIVRVRSRGWTIGVGIYFV